MIFFMDELAPGIDVQTKPPGWKPAVDWLPARPSGIHEPEKPERNADDHFPRARPFAEAPDHGGRSAPLPLCLPPPRRRRRAPAKGAAVTVLKAAKSCFANIVEVSGTIIAREENQVRPERMGLKVAEVMVDAGTALPQARCWRG